MAIYHLSVKTVSRSAGRSATAAAAYRAGCKSPTSEPARFTTTPARVESNLPPSSCRTTPQSGRDRAQLWNAAEQAEKRKNSTVAREFEIALPSELSPAEREKLAHDFTRELVNRHGMAADVAIHAPGKEGDNRNHHAHILLSTRRLGPEGFTEKTRELDDQKTGPQIVTQWRERFASLQNERLREAGHAVQVDHRSHAERGLQAEPTRHLGPAATAIERRTGERSRKGQQHDQDALERLARAKALGELERQGKAADRSIIDLSGDIEAAKRDRAQQQEREARERAQAERQRIERMNSTELAAEIGRLRPPPVRDLVEHDQDVKAAVAKLEQWSEQHDQGRRQESSAKEQAEQWREKHKIQAWFHDKGIGHAPKLRELEEQRDAGREQWHKASPRIEEAMLAKLHAEDYARGRIRFEQAPTLAKVDELEALRREKGAPGVRAAEAPAGRRRPSASEQPCRRTSARWPPSAKPRPAAGATRATTGRPRRRACAR